MRQIFSAAGRDRAHRGLSGWLGKGETANLYHGRRRVLVGYQPVWRDLRYVVVSEKYSSRRCDRISPSYSYTEDGSPNGKYRRPDADTETITGGSEDGKSSHYKISGGLESRPGKS